MSLHNNTKKRKSQVIPWLLLSIFALGTANDDFNKNLERSTLQSFAAHALTSTA